MIMKKTCLKLVLTLIIVITAGLSALSCHNPITFTPASNNDLLGYKEFSLSAENVSLATKVSGTIFVRGNIEKPEDRRVQIAAWMEIDSNDWGGIGFGLPQGWEITGITSDYPRGNPKPESYISTMNRAPGEEIVTYINIGNTKYGAPEVQGGQGSIIIELAWENEKQELPENFKTIIGIGSKYDYIVHPVHETYEVPLNSDYHDVSPYTIHPSPGSYLYDEQFVKSKVAMKDVRTETVTAEADYFNPSHPDAAVKKGETCLIVTGHVQNMDKENPEIAMWAQGTGYYENGNYGNIAAWTLDADHIAGQIRLHLEYMEIGEFTLHLNLPENLTKIQVYTTAYPVTPPVTQTGTPSPTAQSEATLDGSQWRLLTINGEQLASGSYISLNFLDGSLWGSAGLNTYGGHYTVSGNDTLLLSDVMITLIGGPQDIIEQEKAYIRFFRGGGIPYRVKDNRLEIYDAAAPQDSLVFEKLPKNPDNLFILTGTAWQLVSINGEPIPAELSITLNFDRTDASGIAGCFAYQLPYDTSLNPDGSGGIRWGIMSRRTGELPLELEIIAGRYIDLIRLASGFRLNEDKLEILTATGDDLEYKPKSR